MGTQRVNFHHLHYFWAVAKDGNLTRTAKQLRIAQSALSKQIRQLEEDLGNELFVRQGRRLVLSEAGRIALKYADEIFATGEEMLSVLKQGRGREQALRIGAVATLSRNFQESFISPILADPGIFLQLQSGGLTDLLARLSNHDIDLVLSNQPPRSTSGSPWLSRQVAKQPVSLVGKKNRRTFRFPQDLAKFHLVVPGTDSDIRTQFDALCEQIGVQYRIFAEVDDMATMRLLARDTDAVALLPSVVVRDELRSRVLHEYCVVPGLFEKFYAITAERRFQHPLLAPLLLRAEREILAM
ncbi:MAG: LysR substrate-binding domain-containing protein [Deltaproteobacteria bacterium]|nr:LysR substrate-binding domain-containing protein [Deltaproteobacteria bacterium]